MNVTKPMAGKDLALQELKAQARYARERYQIYNAHSYSSRLTSPARLRELERSAKLAQGRLDRAKASHESSF